MGGRNNKMALGNKTNQSKIYRNKKMQWMQVKSSIRQRKAYKGYNLLFCKMKARYDPDADALYLQIKEGEVDHTDEIDENTLIDIDKEGNILGIEILFVKERNPKFVRELEEKHMLSA